MQLSLQDSRAWHAYCIVNGVHGAKSWNEVPLADKIAYRVAVNTQMLLLLAPHRHP